VRERVEVVAGTHSVARNFGVHDATDAPGGDGFHERVARGTGRILPAARRHDVAASIDAGDDRAAEFASDRLRRLGRFDEHRAEHHARGARSEARSDVVPRTNAAARLHGHARGTTDRCERRLVFAGRECTVEIDHVQLRRARCGERFRARDRVVVVALLSARVAAFESDAPSVAQIDRGEKRDRPHAARRRKLSSRTPPVR